MVEPMVESNDRDGTCSVRGWMRSEVTLTRGARNSRGGIEGRGAAGSRRSGVEAQRGPRRRRGRRGVGRKSATARRPARPSAFSARGKVQKNQQIRSGQLGKMDLDAAFLLLESVPGTDLARSLWSALCQCDDIPDRMLEKFLRCACDTIRIDRSIFFFVKWIKFASAEIRSRGLASVVDMLSGFSDEEDVRNAVINLFITCCDIDIEAVRSYMNGVVDAARNHYFAMQILCAIFEDQRLRDSIFDAISSEKFAPAICPLGFWQDLCLYAYGEIVKNIMCDFASLQRLVDRAARTLKHKYDFMDSLLQDIRPVLTAKSQLLKREIAIEDYPFRCISEGQMLYKSTTVDVGQCRPWPLKLVLRFEPMVAFALDTFERSLEALPQLKLLKYDEVMPRPEDVRGLCVDQVLVIISTCEDPILVSHTFKWLSNVDNVWIRDNLFHLLFSCWNRLFDLSIVDFDSAGKTCVFESCGDPHDICKVLYRERDRLPKCEVDKLCFYLFVEFLDAAGGDVLLMTPYMSYAGCRAISHVPHDDNFLGWKDKRNKLLDLLDVEALYMAAWLMDDNEFDLYYNDTNQDALQCYAKKALVLSEPESIERARKILSHEDFVSAMNDAVLAVVVEGIDEGHNEGFDEFELPHAVRTMLAAACAVNTADDAAAAKKTRAAATTRGSKQAARTAEQAKKRKRVTFSPSA